MGNALTATAFPLIAVLALGAGPLETGLLAAALWTPWLVAGLPVGAWVDRVRRRPLMIACNLVSAGMLLSVPAAYRAGVLGFGQLLVTAVVTGTTTVFFATAYQVYLPTLVGPADLIEGNAKVQGSEAATRVIGPGAGGLLTQWVGPVAGVLVDAVSFLVSAVCLLLIRTPEPAPRRPDRQEPLRRQIVEGFRFVVRDPYLRTILLWGAALNLALNGWQAVQVVYLSSAAWSRATS
ncbi:MFS transporter [Actinoplanes sp. NPDC049596]|uniref:MFS transporter n=1 Tax=unclassified Actinoplanes TaxID=2626549 RepID=UPI0034460E2B